MTLLYTLINCKWCSKQYCTEHSSINIYKNKIVLFYAVKKIICHKQQPPRLPFLSYTLKLGSKDLKHFKMKQLVRLKCSVKCKERKETQKNRPSARNFPPSQAWAPAQKIGNVTTVRHSESTTTKYLLHHARMKAKSSALKKLCPPALCDKNQVPSMFFFSCFIEWVTQKGIVVEGRRGNETVREDQRVRDCNKTAHWETGTKMERRGGST